MMADTILYQSSHVPWRSDTVPAVLLSVPVRDRYPDHAVLVVAVQDHSIDGDRLEGHLAEGYLGEELERGSNRAHSQRVTQAGVRSTYTWRRLDRHFDGWTIRSGDRSGRDSRPGNRQGDHRPASAVAFEYRNNFPSNGQSYGDKFAIFDQFVQRAQTLGRGRGFAIMLSQLRKGDLQS